ncbi:unnamed protein product [Camellia sinensis]
MDVAIKDHSGMSKMLMIFYHDAEVNVDCVQLGFLPRNVAKWVAPLSDSGLFWYSGYVYPKEVLVTALEGNTSIVQMILYVSKGPAFSDISRVGQFEHVSSICSLVASIEFRGLQVFGNFKRFYDVLIDSFPIGSVTAQFLATFSEAFGKTSVQFSESEESDPDKRILWVDGEEVKLVVKADVGVEGDGCDMWLKVVVVMVGHQVLDKSPSRKKVVCAMSCGVAPKLQQKGKVATCRQSLGPTGDVISSNLGFSSFTLQSISFIFLISVSTSTTTRKNNNMPAALVGGAFLSATLQVLFDRLASRKFVNFFRAQKLDDKLLRKLKLTLLGLNVVLDDAEYKQITNPAVKDWVDKLKVAVYHADDLLDEIATEALRCKSEAEVRSPTLTSSSNSFDADIVSQIEEIIDRLEYFAKEKDVLGLREVAAQKWNHRLPTTSLVDESSVCGRDNNKEDVIKLLLSDEASGGNQKIDVIAIVGMGGVGKSTLAQFLYNDGRADEHFDMKAWVCVSDEFDVVRVTRTILEAVIPQGSDTTDLKRTLINFKSSSRNNYGNCDILRSPFGYGGHGSRVIVTTRNESVSSIMQTVPIHRLQQLSDEDCWKLFANHAFEKGDCGAHPNLERIGKEIVKKCKGLPLAAKTLAGLLRSKRDVEDWNNILKSGIWDLPKEKQYSSSLKIELSLPPFAFKEMLCLLSNKTREEEGYECFYELQSSEMPMQMSQLKGLQLLTAFVVGKSKGLGIEELKEFRHLQRRLSISSLQNVTNGMGAMEAKLEEKMYREELVLEWSSSTDDSQNERDVLNKLKPHTNLKRLEIKNFGGTRFPDWLGDKSFCNIVHLSLDNCEYCFSLPPFGQLPSLKDLEISRMQGITKVGREFYGDSSLSKPFQSLETLRFKEMLEWVDWYILESGEFSKLKELQVIKCPKLIGGLPKHIPSCVRLEIHECSRLMSQLSNICGAGTSELVFKGCDGVELGCQGLFSLTKLDILDMPNLKESTPELCTLTNLKELRVESCPSLLSFPDTGFPPMFTFLSISYCEVLHSLPPILTCLPKLVFPRSKDMENCYKSLETLSLSSCDALKPMIWHCEKLKSLPEGMHTLFPSLQSLELYGCPEIESFPEGGLPASLHSLEITNCSKLIARRREWDLQRLPFLRHFTLAGKYVMEWGESFLEDGVESFPEEGLLPLTLMSLWIEYLPNLKSLNHRGLQVLGSLKYMKIVKCPKLQSLVEEGLPTSLSMLELFGRPILKPRYLHGEGQDWHKIACVHVIHMDGEVIFEQLTLRPAMDSEPRTLDGAIGDHSGMSKMLMIFYHDVEVNVDCVQLGFLPRNVTKWVAPLSDSGLFRFSGYVYSKDVLVTALEGSVSIVQMICGPAFSDISKVVQSEHVFAICSLVASIQRSTSHWRFQECSSSIGSVTPQFLAAFSAASGNTSVQFSESKDKTWQRLRNISMLHDSIPYPNDRVNHPLACQEEEIPDEEEEVLEAADYVAKEREDEKAYADILWSQSCLLIKLLVERKVIHGLK